MKALNKNDHSGHPDISSSASLGLQTSGFCKVLESIVSWPPSRFLSSVSAATALLVAEANPLISVKNCSIFDILTSTSGKKNLTDGPQDVVRDSSWHQLWASQLLISSP